MSMSLLHISTLYIPCAPPSTGVPGRYISCSQRPCLPECVSCRREGIENNRLWPVQEHRSVCVLLDWQAPHSMDGSGVHPRESLHWEVWCVSWWELTNTTIYLYNAYTSLRYFLLHFFRWSYGITLWEICTLGIYSAYTHMRIWCTGVRTYRCDYHWSFWMLISVHISCMLSCVCMCAHEIVSLSVVCVYYCKT